MEAFSESTIVGFHSLNAHCPKYKPDLTIINNEFKVVVVGEVKTDNYDK